MESEYTPLLVVVGLGCLAVLYAALRRRAQEKRLHDEIAQALYALRLAQYKIEPPSAGSGELPDVLTRGMVRHQIVPGLVTWRDPQSGKEIFVNTPRN